MHYHNRGHKFIQPKPLSDNLEIEKFVSLKSKNALKISQSPKIKITEKSARNHTKARSNFETNKQNEPPQININLSKNIDKNIANNKFMSSVNMKSSDIAKLNIMIKDTSKRIASNHHKGSSKERKSKEKDKLKEKQVYYEPVLRRKSLNTCHMHDSGSEN